MRVTSDLEPVTLAEIGMIQSQSQLDSSRSGLLVPVGSGTPAVANFNRAMKPSPRSFWMEPLLGSAAMRKGAPLGGTICTS